MKKNKNIYIYVKEQITKKKHSSKNSNTLLETDMGKKLIKVGDVFQE